MATRKTTTGKTSGKTAGGKAAGGAKKSVAPPAPSTKATPTKEAQLHAITIAGAGLEKKAIDVEIIDVAGRVDYADYLVLMTGTSDRHVASLVQAVEDAMKKGLKVRPLTVEGLPAANWVLVDYGDVVLHVFQSDSRSLYDIDGLWMDAKRVPIPERAKS